MSIRKSIPLLFLSVLLHSFCNAQSAAIIRGNGLGGLVADPSNGNYLYLPSWEVGILKSTNQGVNWTSYTSGIQGHGVRSVAVDPFNNSIILATVWQSNGATVGTGLGVFKDTDGGQTWSSSTSGMSGSLDLAPIAFDPKDTGIVYVGGYYGLFYKSTNAGTSWTSVSSSQSDINYIIVTNSGNLWTSGWAGVCLSTNGGSTWQNTGLPNINPQIVIASGDPNTLVASGNASNNNNNSLYRTTNGGSTWTNVTGNFGSNQCAIWCSSTDVLATSNKGFFLTTDGGSTWTVVDTTQYVCQQTSLVQAGGNLMGWGGFLFTVTITPPAIIRGNGLGGLVADPSNGNYLYLPSWEVGILKSTNQGVNWTSYTSGIQGHGVRSVAVDPFNNSIVLATVWQSNGATVGTGLGVFKNNGWRPDVEQFHFWYVRLVRPCSDSIRS